MRTFCLFIAILFTSFTYSQENPSYYHYPYPLFTGIKGKADSVIIKKYTIVPRKFGDTVTIKSLAETRFFSFNTDGVVTRFRVYDRDEKLRENISYEITNKRISQIKTINYRDSPERKNLQLIRQEGNKEVWVESYKAGKSGTLQDTIHIEYTRNSKIEQRKSAATSLITTETFTYTPEGLLTSRISGNEKNASIHHLKYDKQGFLLNIHSGSSISSLGSMTNYVFFTYKTDSRKNWTERKAYNKNGNISYLEEQIIYYRN